MPQFVDMKMQHLMYVKDPWCLSREDCIVSRPCGRDADWLLGVSGFKEWIFRPIKHASN